MVAPLIGGIGGLLLGLSISYLFFQSGNIPVAIMGLLIGVEGAFVSVLAFPRYRTGVFVERFVTLSATGVVVVFLGFIYSGGALYSLGGLAVTAILCFLLYLFLRSFAGHDGRARTLSSRRPDR